MAPRKPVTDFSLLDDKVKGALLAKAREQALDKRRKAAEDAFLAQAVKEAEQELDPQPELEMRTVVIDVAGHADRITLDDRAYMHGEVYTVSKPVYDTLRDLMQATHRHEHEIRNANSSRYQQPARELYLSPSEPQGVFKQPSARGF